MALLRPSRCIYRRLFFRQISVLGQDFPDDHMTNLTERIVKNVDLKKHCIPQHPTEIIKREIYNFFNEQYQSANFDKIEDLSPIVSVSQNFDSVLIPKD